MPPKLDWKSARMKRALWYTLGVGALCVCTYLMVVFVWLLPDALEVDQRGYVLHMVTMTSEMITTAIGVFLGLSLFACFLRIFWEAGEDDDREKAAGENG